MTAVNRFDAFRFISYSFNEASGEATFSYAFDDAYEFNEVITFQSPEASYCADALDAALFYAFIVLGTSYYKLFPGAKMRLEVGELTQQQADFFSDVYRGGLSQFIFENDLTPDVIARFNANTENTKPCPNYGASGIILQQSGGKDSLLAAELLKEQGEGFVAWHMSSTGHHPEVIDLVSSLETVDVVRKLDLATLRMAQADGGLNGHVPFSAITAGLALIDAVLRRKSFVIAAMEASSDEGNTMMGDFEVNHMYSKTFSFEVQLQDYIHQNIAKELNYLSLIRPFTDLRVAELFAKYCWGSYAKQFASCNVANYKQGEDDGNLSWCGDCSKCANSFLLFAPFVSYDELTSVFSGQNLFEKDSLRADLTALLGLGGVKPFECVGTVDELRAAYHLAAANDSRFVIAGIEVPQAETDFRAIHPYQDILSEFLPAELLA